MFHKLFAFVDSNSSFIVAVIMLLLVALFALVLVLDARVIFTLRSKNRRLLAYIHYQDTVTDELNAEIRHLKACEFAARTDCKREVKKRDKRIAQLESEKKQLLKWDHH